MNNSNVIKKSQADIGTDTDNPLTREERIVVIPNPTTADADDDFGFTTTISFFNDGKRYNPSTMEMIHNEYLEDKVNEILGVDKSMLNKKNLSFIRKETR